MLHLTAFTFGPLLRSAAASLLVAGLVACGGGGGGGGGGGFGGGVVVAPAPVVAPLSLALTRAGPQAVEVAWSDDPFVESFLVRRDGFALATVTTTSLIDATVFFDETYCYQVEGYDATGLLVAATSTGCITIL